MGFFSKVGSFLGNLGKSAVSSLTGAAIDTGAKAISANQQFKQQMQLQQQQQEYNTEMWNKQNEYNSPTNQIARLNEAGINPQIALSGGGLQNVGATSTTPGGASFSASSPTSSGAAMNSSFIQQQQMNEQLENLKAQRENINAKTAEQLLDNYVKAQTQAERVDIGKQAARNAKNMADLTYEKMIWQQGQNDLFDATYQQKISQEEIKTNTMMLERAIKQKDLDYKEKQLAAALAETWARVSLNYKVGQASLDQAKAAVLNALANSKYLKAKTNYQHMVNGSIKTHGAYYETELGKAKLKDWLNSQQGERELRNALAVGGERGFFEFLGTTADNWLGTMSYKNDRTETTKYNYNKKGQVSSKTTTSSGKGNSSSTKTSTRRRRAPKLRPGRRG